MRARHLVLGRLVIRWRIELLLAVVLIQRQLLLQYSVLDHQLLEEHLLRPVDGLGMLVKSIVVIVHVTVPLVRVMLEQLGRVRRDNGLEELATG